MHFRNQSFENLLMRLRSVSMEFVPIVSNLRQRHVETRKDLSKTIAALHFILNTCRYFSSAIARLL